METAPETARDYLTAAARALAAEIDAFNALPASDRIDAMLHGRFSPNTWIGRATAVLKEVARDA